MQNKSVTKILLGIFIMGISFLGLNHTVSGACDWRNNTGSRDNPTECNSTSARDPEFFDNDINLSTLGENVQIFLKMANLEGNINCEARKARNIQTEMQKIGGACSTCIDGRIGNKTKSTLQNSCLAAACPSPLKAPSLQGGNLKCDDGYLLSGGYNGKCCDPIPAETPDIMVDNKLCNETCEYNSTKEVIEVVVDYTKNKANLSGGSNAVTIAGGEISGEIRPSPSEKKIFLDVKPNGGDITITVPDGAMDLVYGAHVPGKNAKLTSTGCAKPASSSGTCEDGYVIYKNCCVECNNPPDENNKCGSGFKQGAGGCCECDTAKKQKQCADGETVNSDSCKCVCDPTKACCGVKLNTVVPFIGDCIEMTTSNDVNSSSRTGTVTVNQLNAFPFLMQGLMKILITAILIFSVIIVIVAGLMMTADPALSTYKKGMDLLKNVIISLILLGCSGLILKLINPSFFGG